MYYPLAKLSDDTPSGFCVIMLTYTHKHTDTCTEQLIALLMSKK